MIVYTRISSHVSDRSFHHRFRKLSPPPRSSQRALVFFALFRTIGCREPRRSDAFHFISTTSTNTNVGATAAAAANGGSPALPFLSLGARASSLGLVGVMPTERQLPRVEEVAAGTMLQHMLRGWGKTPRAQPLFSTRRRGRRERKMMMMMIMSREIMSRFLQLFPEHLSNQTLPGRSSSSTSAVVPAGVIRNIPPRPACLMLLMMLLMVPPLRFRRRQELLRLFNHLITVSRVLYFRRVLITSVEKVGVDAIVRRTSVARRRRPSSSSSIIAPVPSRRRLLLRRSLLAPLLHHLLRLVTLMISRLPLRPRLLLVIVRLDLGLR